MEKYRNSGYKSIRYRLLTAVAFIAFFVPSVCFGAVALRSLKIVPEKSSCFVGDTCNFILEIPEYLPSRIDATVQSTPDGVALMASSKDSYEVNGVKGTRIVFTFKFSKKGTYKIPSLATRVDWFSINIPFQSITVYDDPRTLLPEISIKLPKNVYAQEAFSADVTVRFFAEALEAYSDLDESVIIKRSDSTLALPFTQQEFTESFSTVATYELTPIEAGTLTVPSFHVLVRTYAGGQIVLTSQPQTLKVLAAKKQSVAEAGNSYYASVLGNSDLEDEETELSQENSDFYEDIIPEEVALGIVRARTGQKVVLYLSLSFFVLCVAAFIVFLYRRVKQFAKIAVIASVVFLVLFVVFAVLVSNKKGVALYDASVYSIPEQMSSSVSSVLVGEVMKVKAVRTGWYSVRLLNGSEGWLKAEDCIYCGD